MIVFIEFNTSQGTCQTNIISQQRCKQLHKLRSFSWLRNKKHAKNKKQKDLLRQRVHFRGAGANNTRGGLCAACSPARIQGALSIRIVCVVHNHTLAANSNPNALFRRVDIHNYDVSVGNTRVSPGEHASTTLTGTSQPIGCPAVLVASKTNINVLSNISTPQTKAKNHLPGHRLSNNECQSRAASTSPLMYERSPCNHRFCSWQ